MAMDQSWKSSKSKKTCLRIRWPDHGSVDDHSGPPLEESQVGPLGGCLRRPLRVWVCGAAKQFSQEACRFDCSLEKDFQRKSKTNLGDHRVQHGRRIRSQSVPAQCTGTLLHCERLGRASVTHYGLCSECEGNMDSQWSARCTPEWMCRRSPSKVLLKTSTAGAGEFGSWKLPSRSRILIEAAGSLVVFPSSHLARCHRNATHETYGLSLGGCIRPSTERGGQLRGDAQEVGAEVKSSSSYPISSTENRWQSEGQRWKGEAVRSCCPPRSSRMSLLPEGTSGHALADSRVDEGDPLPGSSTSQPLALFGRGKPESGAMRAFCPKCSWVMALQPGFQSISLVLGRPPSEFGHLGAIGIKIFLLLRLLSVVFTRHSVQGGQQLIAKL